MVLLFAIAVVLLIIVMGFAYSHDAPLGWTYPSACCASLDCKQVDERAVKERPQGYEIASTGEVVGYLDRRVKDSPDGRWHLCARLHGIEAGRTICLFVPPKGF
jgi:hypothetical protein